MTFTATEKTLEMEEHTSASRERGVLGSKLIAEIEDRLIRDESTLGISLDGMANIPHALLAIVHLKKAEEEHRKHDAEFETTWNAKLVHHLETTRTDDWQMLLSRLEFQHAMDDVFRENEELLVQVRAREAEAGAELETLKAGSLHILRRKADGSGYEDVCCMIDGKTGRFVDLKRTPITDANEVQQVRDAAARLEHEYPERTVTSWQHMSATVQHLDRLHGLEKDIEAANTTISGASASVQTTEEQAASLAAALDVHKRLAQALDTTLDPPTEQLSEKHEELTTPEAGAATNSATDILKQFDLAATAASRHAGAVTVPTVPAGAFAPH